MTLLFSWHDDEQTIARIDFQDRGTWEEYHAVIDQVAEALKSATHRIDVILNNPSFGMPPGNPMPHIRTTSQQLSSYPNMGVIVLVSDRSTSRIVKMLVSTVYRIYGIDTRIIGDFVKTLEEAEASITQARNGNQGASV